MERAWKHEDKDEGNCNSIQIGLFSTQNMIYFKTLEFCPFETCKHLQ